MPTEAFSNQANDPSQLLFAVCHEISNLVAAIRLQAHLLDEDLDARGLAVASLDIDDLTARTASLLAMVRPMMSPAPESIPSVSAGVIAQGIERALSEYGGRGFEITFNIEPDLPDVTAEPELFHYLMLCHAYGAMEAMEELGERGQIRIEVTSREKEVVFAIEDEAPKDAEHLSWWKASLRGRALESAVTHYILDKRGARFEVRRVGGLNRTELAAPRG